MQRPRGKKKKKIKQNPKNQKRMADQGTSSPMFLRHKSVKGVMQKEGAEAEERL